MMNSNFQKVLDYLRLFHWTRLTSLIQTFTDFAELDSASGIFTPGLMVGVVLDPRYYQLTAATAQLKYVDLELLDSREDKLCFYGNLINLMTLHVLLREVQRQVSKEEVRGLLCVSIQPRRYL